MPHCGGLKGNQHGSSMARWKAQGRLPISANWTFFASSHGWGAMSGYWSKLCCLKGGGSRWEQISGERGGRPPTNFGIRKSRIHVLSRGVICVILRLAVLIQYSRVSYRQTDRQTQTDTRWWLLPAHRMRRAGKKFLFWATLCGT